MRFLQTCSVCQNLAHYLVLQYSYSCLLLPQKVTELVTELLHYKSKYIPGKVTVVLKYNFAMWPPLLLLMKSCLSPPFVLSHRGTWSDHAVCLHICRAVSLRDHAHWCMKSPPTPLPPTPLPSSLEEELWVYLVRVILKFRAQHNSVIMTAIWMMHHNQQQFLLLMLPVQQ